LDSTLVPSGPGAQRCGEDLETSPRRGLRCLTSVVHVKKISLLQKTSATCNLGKDVILFQSVPENSKETIFFETKSCIKCTQIILNSQDRNEIFEFGATNRDFGSKICFV
jgi:hypothetical protein